MVSNPVASPQWQHADIATATVRAGDAPRFKNLAGALAAMKPHALVMPSRTDLYFVVRSRPDVDELTFVLTRLLPLACDSRKSR